MPAPMLPSMPEPWPRAAVAREQVARALDDHERTTSTSSLSTALRASRGASARSARSRPPAVLRARDHRQRDPPAEPLLVRLTVSGPRVRGQTGADTSGTNVRAGRWFFGYTILNGVLVDPADGPLDVSAYVGSPNYVTASAQELVPPEPQDRRAPRRRRPRGWPHNPYDERGYRARSVAVWGSDPDSPPSRHADPLRERLHESAPARTWAPRPHPGRTGPGQPCAGCACLRP